MARATQPTRRVRDRAVLAPGAIVALLLGTLACRDTSKDADPRATRCRFQPLQSIAGETFSSEPECARASAAFVDRFRERRVAPVALVVAAAREYPVVFVGDNHPVAEPKEIVVEAIAAIATGSGLDAVVLELASRLQGVVDDYLA